MMFLTKWLRALALSLILGATFGAFGGHAAFAASYVDPGLKDLAPDQKVTVANPQPVQILFQFQTDGAANGRATDFLKKKVLEMVMASGLFSEVVEAPVPNGAIISITINNVVKDALADATAQGFVTGLTFGLKGSMITDRYIATVEYLDGAGGPKISRTLNHAIHTSLGLKSAPEGMVKSKNGTEAVMTMVNQVISNGLNQVAADQAFPGAQVPAATPAPAAPAALPAEPAAPAAPAEPATPAPATPATPTAGQ